MYSFLISTFIAGCFGLSFQLSCSKLTASRHHLRPPPVSIMDAQWQQYYWNHYLLQQQQHQVASGTDTSHYTPTTAYGEPFHSYASTASGSSLHATAFDITNISHIAAKHLSFLPTAATTSTPYGLTSNTTTEVLQAQSHSLGSTGTSSYSSISNSNHPRILALHGFLLGFQRHSRTSTPPSHPAYPMVPTRRDRRLADF